ncbi:substrate-binding periplasmic protein [Paraglaciecola aestuariivivens]
MCLVLTSTASPYAQQQISNKTLRLAVIYNEEPPFLFTDKNNQFQGILPELAQALSRELNVRIEYVPTPRKGLEQVILSGQADLGFLPKEWIVNSAKMAFSNAAFNHRDYLYSLTAFNTSGDPIAWLTGKTICVRQDYQYPILNQYFDRHIAKPIKVSNQVPLLTLIEKKRCDLVFMNELRKNWMEQNLGFSGKIWRSPLPLEVTAMTFFVKHHNKNVLLKVNQALAKLKHSGELAKILSAFISAETLPEILVD